MFVSKQQSTPDNFQRFSNGTMAPTTAPNFAELTELEGGCPEEYETDLYYESGDVVSYSMAPDRNVVYQCRVSFGC